VSRIERRLERTRLRGERRVALEDALLGGRFAGYAAYRLRWVVLSRVVGLGVHAVELLFLTQVFRGAHLGSMLILVNLAMLASAAWWGALDVQRSRIRELGGEPGEIAMEIGVWLRRGLLLAVAVLVVTGGLALTGARGNVEPLLLGYAAVVALRLAVDLVARAYYSGIYARQRVYRPPLAIVAIELAGLAVILACWRLAGAWSVPLGLLVQLVLSRGLLVVYSRRAYRTRGIPTPPLRERTRPAADVGHPVMAALAGVATRLGSLLVVAVLLGQRGPGIEVQVVHLMAPLLATAGSWPQVFYLDFRRLEDDPAARLRDRLGSMLEPMALVIGVACWAIGAGYAVAILGGRGADIAIALAPLVVAHSWLGRSQLRYFAQGEYARVIVGAVVLLAVTAGWFAIERRLDIGGPATHGVMLAFASLAAALVVDRLRGRPWRAPEQGLVRALAPWMRALTDVTEPVRLGRLAMRSATNTERLALAERMAEELGSRGAVATRSRGLVWFERAAGEPTITRARLVELSAGRVDDVRELAADSGEAALLDAADRDLLPAPGKPDDDQTDGATSLLDALAGEFSRRFPDGLVEDLGEPAPCPALAALPSETRRTIWQQAQLLGRGGRPRPQGDHEVTVYAPRGAVELIFCAPRQAAPTDRRAWRELLARAHAAAALGRDRPQRDAAAS
jgi:hypothetical protein